MRDGFPRAEEVSDLTTLLLKPSSRETLYLYLAVLKSAVSEALVREDEGVQKPVYYASHSMNGPQIRYQKLEKLLLALLLNLSDHN